MNTADQPNSPFVDRLRDHLNRAAVEVLDTQRGHVRRR